MSCVHVAFDISIGVLISAPGAQTKFLATPQADPRCEPGTPSYQIPENTLTVYCTDL